MNEQLLSKALKQRGHEIISSGSDKDILLPVLEDKILTSYFKGILYSLMKDEEFRKNLRDWAYTTRKFQHISSFIDLGTTFDGNFAKTLKVKENRRQKYSHTFEWFISEMLIREFGSKASGFNIRLKDALSDDEFDCISLIDDGLVFIECKTGKKEIYSEVKKFVRRDTAVSAQYSFFIFDRDYTFRRDEKDLPEITKDKAKRVGIDRIEKISNSNCSFYRIDGDNRYFLVSPGFQNLENRIRHMFGFISMVREGGGNHRKEYKIERIKFTEDN